MAGPTPGTAQSFWASTTVGSGGTLTYELNTGQCYECAVIINCDLHASASEGTTLDVSLKTGASGTACNDPFLPYGQNDNDPHGYSFILPPGTYSIDLNNEDASYEVSDVDGWYRLST